MSQIQDRPDVITFPNGRKQPLPFSTPEYETRLAKLRVLMLSDDIDVVVFTSMHNVAYYTGFLYCSFGRSYACVVTKDRCVLVSANIDGGQPWRRSHAENLIYTDWQRGNFWHAVIQAAGSPKRIGYEADHVTMSQFDQLVAAFQLSDPVDISVAVMRSRMTKSAEEIALITHGARIADAGGFAIRDAIRRGASEQDVASAGRHRIESEIALAFPDSEIRDSWVWFQSGINTDGAHNPLTTRKIGVGDILSLNSFAMISGYYTALERTLFLGEPDFESMRYWRANVGAHELGISLIKPGTSCSEICGHLNDYFASLNLLQYRSFGYGHSFGILSHYYGREAGLELREDIDTVLQPGMVVSMEPMLTIPDGTAGAGGYREHDILVVTRDTAVNITKFPFGPEHNIITP